MKKIYILLLITAGFLLLSVVSLTVIGDYRETDETHILHRNGKEYAVISKEFCVFGRSFYDSGVKGEFPFSMFPFPYQTGLYKCENDPDRRVLEREMPHNEFRLLYRDTSLPPLSTDPDACIRFEFIGGDPDIEHMTCEGGITDPAERDAFLDAIRNGPTAEEAGLYRALETNDAGFWKNCYSYGYVYGYYTDEPNLALCMKVTSFDDKAYSIRIGYTEYVLPTEWLEALQEKVCADIDESSK